MADTGVLNFQTQTGAWDTTSSGFGATGTMLSDDGGYTAAMSNTTIAYVEDSSGNDVPSGATVNGMEVYCTDCGYYNAFAGATLQVEVSINGGSSYGSTTLSQALTGVANLTPTTDFTLGSNSETWGISWGTSGIDVSDLKLKLTNVRSGFGLSHFDYISAKIYYTEAAAATTSSGLTLKGGTFTLKGGTLTIK